MSALAEMLQGKETLWRELSAAWDCSLPGAALGLGWGGGSLGGRLRAEKWYRLLSLFHTSAITHSENHVYCVKVHIIIIIDGSYFNLHYLHYLFIKV